MTKKVVLTGAGSGGHITPLLAVAAEIKRTDPNVTIIYIGQTGDKLGDIPAKDSNIDESFTVRAGKFRRYHGEGLRQLLDIPTLLLNIRDAFFVLIGLLESWRLLRRIQPDVIFVKGGFVGVPIGLAAARLHIPFITHDSDAIPGLANRIIARWATLHAVALPKEVYDYPAERTVTTGIPLQADFKPVTEAMAKQYRSKLGVPVGRKLLFIIGGGLGSQRVNAAVAEAVPHLMNEFTDLHVIHVVGRANKESMQSSYRTLLSSAQQGRVKIIGFTNDVATYSGAADVIITRAGATNLAEFALQGRACVVVPSPFLTGGHQLKNAQYLADQHAAVVLSETDLADDPNRLAKQVSELLRDDQRRELLGRNLSKFAQPHATRDLARTILEQVSQKTQL